MRVAIVGGGASGVAAAWLLDGAHEITLFERQSVLGGHVRTLGRNVACAAIPAGVALDAGVVEFDRVKFPCFHALLAAVGLRADDMPEVGSTTLSLPDGRHFHSPEALREEHAGFARLVQMAEQLPLVLRHKRFLAHPIEGGSELDGRPLDAFLRDDTFSTWLRALVMYAYSTPYRAVGAVSAGLALPMLHDFLEPTHWTRVPGGAFGWIDRVAGLIRGEIRLGARIARIARTPSRVTIRHEHGETESFDAVVIAVPPHRVLGLLEDPTEDERAWFGGFRGGPIETVVHSDTSLYERRGYVRRSEFDLFGLRSGDFGYNAYLNRLSSLPLDGGPQYSLAFHMDSEIDPARVVHRQVHDVALYGHDAMRRRSDLLRANGTNRTFFAGAFLGDGLHEGAVRSAISVAERLGGRTIHAA